MASETVARTQRLWARWTGFLLVLTNATAMFAI